MKKKLTKIFLIGFFLLGISAASFAQEGTYYTVQDLESWSSASLTYKASKKFKISLNQQLRLKDNSATVDEYFTQLGFQYKFANNFNFGFAGRYLRENDNKGDIQGYENLFRWNADLGFKHDINRLTLKYRARFQSKSEFGTDEQSDTYFRLKAGVDYNIKDWKLDPEISAEIFNGRSSDEGFNKIRFTAGTEYKTKNIGDFGLFYRIQKELIGAYPKTTNIIGFKYEYTIKRKSND